MEAFLTLVLIVGAVLLFDARGRMKRLELRLRQVEDALRQPVPAAPLEAWTSADEQAVAGEQPVAVAPVPPHEVLASKTAGPEPVALEPVAPGPVAPAPSVARPAGLSFNFEDLFGRKLPIWAGGITLAIAGVLIVKYAIDIGLFGRVFTPGVQAAFGLVFGCGLVGGAEWAHRKRERVDDPRVAQALSGAGISTLYAVVLVAANAYQLISPLAAFACLAVVTALGLALSLRHGAPSALLGLAGGLAAPALTVGITANVPLLAIYMAFTVAGLVGVARAQRCPWLALIALVGGAGWSLCLILAGEALTVMGSLSIGMFVALIAVAAPLFAFEDARSAVLRSVAAVVGAAQLALLVATGGFDPLDWGLFALIAAACQWLAWRDESLRIVPTVGAALSVLLLLIWPDPAHGWLLAISLALAAIHTGPLVARLWRQPVAVRRAIELCAIATAAPVIALRHFWSQDDLIAVAGFLAGLAVLAAAAIGWNAAGRQRDSRFAWLVATGAGLLTVAALFGMPQWQGPLWSAALAALVILLARPAQDSRVERIGAGYGVVAMILLLATGPATAEFEALGQGAASVDGHAVLRWAIVAATAALASWRAQGQPVRDGAGFAAAGLAYGATAQFAGWTALHLVAPLGLLALAFAARRIEPARLRGAATGFALIVAGWAFLAWGAWLLPAIRSLAGIPMKLDLPAVAPWEVTLRLLVPAVLVAASLRLAQGRLSRPVALFGAIFAGALGIIAIHCLYRDGFAAAFGTDFIATGLAQRLLWAGLIAATGVALWKRGGGMLASHAAPIMVAIAALHVTVYSLILHDPLWADQAVGALPLANLLLPLYAALPLCVWLIGRMAPAAGRYADAALQPVAMAMIALLGWASLRHLFHPALLTEPGVGETEDILRSILGIALAVGYLLWGIRAHRRDWRIASLALMLAAVAKVFLFDASGLEGLLRIASFVALGFSLIGIGWLYSRQLRGAEAGTSTNSPTSSSTQGRAADITA